MLPERLLTPSEAWIPFRARQSTAIRGGLSVSGGLLSRRKTHQPVNSMRYFKVSVCKLLIPDMPKFVTLVSNGAFRRFRVDCAYARLPAAVFGLATKMLGRGCCGRPSSAPDREHPDGNGRNSKFANRALGQTNQPPLQIPPRRLPGPFRTTLTAEWPHTPPDRFASFCGHPVGRRREKPAAPVGCCRKTGNRLPPIRG